MTQQLNVTILLFNDVELLDFCGPFEVFTVANREVEPPRFNVFTVAESESIVTRGGLTVRRDYPLHESPDPHVLLIPGGFGVNQLLERRDILRWVSAQAAKSDMVTSVCTGAVLLGRCGLLDGICATTHHLCLDQLREVAPTTRVVTDQRFVDTGRIVTSAGISAGIDMSLHIVRRLIGHKQACAVAERMAYEWTERHDAGPAHQNELGQSIGRPLEQWRKRPEPPRTPMTGRYCRILPLDPESHGEALWDAYQADSTGGNWTYLAYGPFPTPKDFRAWLCERRDGDDP
ncbi:MAG: DJ-1/PfpI family protein, partial [Planctomycetota bacterium]